MAVEKEAAPHVATIEQLARGEDPASGAPVGEIPGRGAGYKATKLLVYGLLVALALLLAACGDEGPTRLTPADLTFAQEDYAGKLVETGGTVRRCPCSTRRRRVGTRPPSGRRCSTCSTPCRWRAGGWWTAASPSA